MFELESHKESTKTTTYCKKFPQFGFQRIVLMPILSIRLIVETFSNDLTQKWKLACL